LPPSSGYKCITKEDMVYICKYCQNREYPQALPAAVNHIHLYPQCNNTNWSYITRYSIILPTMHTDIYLACEDHMRSLMMAMVRRNM
jgi:hypothetical protein